jgi:hypothetical protein
MESSGFAFIGSKKSGRREEAAESVTGEKVEGKSAKDQIGSPDSEGS